MYYLKRKVCLNSFNSACFFKIFFFSTPECRFPAKRRDSQNDIVREKA